MISAMDKANAPAGQGGYDRAPGAHGEVRVRLRDESAGPGRRERAGPVRALHHGTGIYLWHGQFLSRDRACQAFSDLFVCALSPGALAAAARKTAGFLASALAAVTRHLIACEVVHFDDSGSSSREARLVHSASAGKFVLFTVHAKRGKDRMKAAWVLPSLRRDRRPRRLGALRHLRQRRRPRPVRVHVLRELIAVTETGTDLDRTWAQQAIDALLALNEAAQAARAAGQDAIDPETRTSTRTGTARPRPPGSPSAPPARASSSRNGTPSPRG